MPNFSATVRLNRITSTYANYGRSFTPVQFLQWSVAADRQTVAPERSNMVDAGLRITARAWKFDFAGWHHAYQNTADVSLTKYVNLGDSIANGLDLRLGAEHAWTPKRSRWAHPHVLTTTGGLQVMRGRIRSGEFRGNKIPWYPDTSLWWMLRLSVGGRLDIDGQIRYEGRQFTDGANSTSGSADGGVGPLPARALADVSLTYRISGRGNTLFEISAGLRNITDSEWFSRTDDRNRGLLAIRPRTFLVAIRFDSLFARWRHGARA